MLKAAGARLAKPKVVASFSKWKDDWNVEELERTKELEQKAWASMSDAEKAQAEVHALKKELEYLQRKFDEAGLEYQTASSVAERRRRNWKQSLRQREKRIEHTQQMAIKRIIKRDLARGWVGWLENYLDQRRRIC